LSPTASNDQGTDGRAALSQAAVSCARSFRAKPPWNTISDLVDRTVAVVRMTDLARASPEQHDPHSKYRQHQPDDCSQDERKAFSAP
jgi:hypothetical protein